MVIQGRSTGGRNSASTGGGGGGASQPPAKAAIPSHEGDVAAIAATNARAARARLAEAEDIVSLAGARLQEAVDAAPRVSPRAAAATHDVAAAEKAVDDTAEDVLEARRFVQDRDGAVVMAQAKVDELGTSSKATGAQLVAAGEGLARAERARESAVRAATRADHAREDAGSALAGAEQAAELIRQEPQAEPSSVLKARMELARAHRGVHAAQEEAAATRRAYEQVVKNTEGGGAALTVRLHYGSLEQFVVEYLLRNWRRRCEENQRVRWCSMWWKHAEAITRLENLWEAFEAMRHEKPPSMSTLWRDHIDYHMQVLTSEHGPFDKCSQQHHERLPLWLSDRAEDTLFPYDRDCEFEELQEERRQEIADRLASQDRAAHQDEGARA